ncbi:MAG: EsaB/YukD family protein [Clostridia bacterium]|nr:EsaB/YukD family protein [Clostridia bacterium]
MDNKILIRLEVPAVKQEFEMRIPDHLPVKRLVPLMVKAVSDLSEGAYVSSGHELLCCKRLNAMLDTDAALAEYGLISGEHLLLF